MGLKTGGASPAFFGQISVLLLATVLVDAEDTPRSCFLFFLYYRSFIVSSRRLLGEANLLSDTFRIRKWI